MFTTDEGRTLLITFFMVTFVFGLLLPSHEFKIGASPYRAMWRDVHLGTFLLNACAGAFLFIIMNFDWRVSLILLLTLNIAFMIGVGFGFLLVRITSMPGSR